MADDRDFEPTEPASQRRLEEARAQGQVARSPEFLNLMILVGAAAALLLMTGSLSGNFGALFAQAVTLDRAAIFSPALMLPLLQSLVFEALWTLLPVVLGIFVIAAAAPLAVGGWLFAPQALTLDATRLSPLRGVARLFSLAGGFDLFRIFLKLALLAAGLFAILWQNTADLTQWAGADAPTNAALAARWLARNFLFLAALLAIVAAADVAFRIWYHRRGLRMTRAELAQEYRETEGDPAVRARIRARQRQLGAKRPTQARDPK